MNTPIKTGSQLEQPPEEAAKEKGQVIVRPGPREVFIDIDSQADYDWCVNTALPAYRGETMEDVNEVRVTPSPSGEPGHVHVVFAFEKDLTPEKRILLQALFGSDRHRELLSYLRLVTRLRKPEDVTVFFELPENKTVEQGSAPLSSENRTEDDAKARNCLDDLVA